MLPDFALSCSLFEQNGLTLTEDLYHKFDIYAQFLVEYNEKVNLTAITEPQEILVKHFIDSIRLTEFVQIPVNASLIDVGTGAGFPSVPLKLYRDDISITLLDSLNKRITFLRELCERLEIHADFVHERAENVSVLPEYREKFDVATARAVANMSTLSELCIPFVKIGGVFAAMKGPTENILLGVNSVHTLGGDIESSHEYILNGEGRKLVVVRKKSHTPPKFPRNSGQIKKNPL